MAKRRCRELPSQITEAIDREMPERMERFLQPRPIAVLILSKPLQEEILKAERALITVYAPNGNPFQAVASLKDLGTAIETLNKRRGPSSPRTE
jgi:hypothetical protein